MPNFFIHTTESPIFFLTLAWINKRINIIIDKKAIKLNFAIPKSSFKEKFFCINLRFFSSFIDVFLNQRDVSDLN